MNAQDRFWNILKDDWTGRIYKDVGKHYDGMPMFVKDDLGDTIVYKKSFYSGSPAFTAKKEYIKKAIALGNMVRVE